MSTTLLSPAAGAIAACTRVIVAPDGPLLVLPFSALPDPSASDGRYLVESKPISVVASATVLAQLKGHRPPPRETRLAAFSDPSYPTTTSSEASPALEHAVRSGLSLESLPATRVEVEGLGGLFGEAATLWVGPNATEERAKAVGEGVTFVRFAAHGMVDELRPLSSALALAIPEQAIEGRIGTGIGSVTIDIISDLRSRRRSRRMCPASPSPPRTRDLSLDGAWRDRCLG